jgi:hypothetical protein
MFARTRMGIGRQDLNRPFLFHAPHNTRRKIRRAQMALQTIIGNPKNSRQAKVLKAGAASGRVLDDGEGWPKSKARIGREARMRRCLGFVSTIVFLAAAAPSPALAYAKHYRTHRSHAVRRFSPPCKGACRIYPNGKMYCPPCGE